MQRRQFLKVGMLTSVVGISAASALWLSQGGDAKSLTLEALLSKLEMLGALPTEVLTKMSLGQWNSAQVFTHCAQSVEFSMSGFPQHKSAVFKRTIGTIAFSAFAIKGAMTHNLAEAIPAAPELDPSIDAHQALARLINSLQEFKQYQGKLAPHFAYGKLNKQDYELAHVLHFYNHLDNFKSFSIS
ncbi:DUF1569 domain-containing protein [Shewanella inventionis]|uniref:DUF1569 domain-containing protein n=1 Tax=Shewanella inventionis TaxID=1738770 RepID=A0ABQ1J502_9GAMM|nr:DUF1569 domain-containing protein [Shewanella inventionis]MCL1157435.1 DUF1569 domain-containing protein [Shewanella inventionis]UAL42082.1 DUF1569 domain-containing protein [Shewanella inventionis]GGB58811.1 hypothetical protein GCM10011607_19320 [Shewanella inventionis]